MCDGVSSSNDECGNGKIHGNREVMHDPCTTKPPQTPKPYQPPPKTYAKPTPPPYQPPPPKTYNDGPKTYGKKKKHKRH